MVSLSETDLIVGHGSHPGETGKNNEDNYAVAAFRSAAGERVTLAIVADGIGGHRAGEVASELAVRNVLDVARVYTGDDYVAMLTQAIGQAAHAVAEQAQAQRDLKGMGTTCVVACVVGRRLYAAYVGDSRLHYIQGQTIRQLSVDHTWIQQALEHGLLTKEEAPRSSQRHVVLRYLGKDPNVKPDFRLRLAEGEPNAEAEAHQGLPLAPGDKVVLCSDGLSDLVEGHEILAVLAQQAPQAGVEQLMTMARQRGGYDNITVVVLQVPA